MRTDQAIVLFDGVCNLCEGVVRFIVRHDPDSRFRFAPLQSEPARRLLEKHGLPTDTVDTFVLVEGSRCLTRSDAALAVVRHLPGAWRMLRVLVVVPRPLRDWAYTIVVRNRYRWFGRKQSCMVPTPELTSRFLS